MLLLVDNRDSFTFNLVQAFAGLGARVEVIPGETATPAAIAARRPRWLVVGPGPGSPAQAAGSVASVRALSGRLPILGVCLGHQALAVAFGGSVVRAPAPVHGKPSRLRHDGTGLFRDLPAAMEVGRYHSLAVDEATLPGPLRVTARAEEDGTVQALAHREHPTFGLQFHPESVLTPDGAALLRRFLETGAGR